MAAWTIGWSRDSKPQEAGSIPAVATFLSFKENKA